MNTKITVRFEEEECKALREYAEREDLKISQVIRKAVKEYLQTRQ